MSSHQNLFGASFPNQGEKFAWTRLATLAATLDALGAIPKKGAPVTQTFTEERPKSTGGEVVWWYEEKTKNGLKVADLIKAWGELNGPAQFQAAADEIKHLQTLEPGDRVKVGGLTRSAKERLAELINALPELCQLAAVAYCRGSHQIREQKIRWIYDGTLAKAGMPQLVRTPNSRGHSRIQTLEGGQVNPELMGDKGPLLTPPGTAQDAAFITGAGQPQWDGKPSARLSCSRYALGQLMGVAICGYDMKQTAGPQLWIDAVLITWLKCISDGEVDRWLLDSAGARKAALQWADGPNGIMPHTERGIAAITNYMIEFRAMKSSSPAYGDSSASKKKRPAKPSARRGSRR